MQEGEDPKETKRDETYPINQFNSSDTQTLIDNGANHVISNLKNLPYILSKYDDSLKT